MGRKTGRRSSRGRRLHTLLVLLVIGTGLTLLSWVMWRTRDWETLALHRGTDLLGVAITYLLLARWLGEPEPEEESGIAGVRNEVKDVAEDAAGRVRRFLFGRAVKAVVWRKKRKP